MLFHTCLSAFHHSLSLYWSFELKIGIKIKQYHIIFYSTNLLEVQIHLSDAIFMDYRAIYYPVIWVWARSALAAHSAYRPPLPMPMTSSISKTFPVPSSSIIISLSITISVASRCLICLPVLHYFAQLMQLFSVCFGYLDITCSNPSIKQNASASEPANPQKTPSVIFLIFLASVFTLVPPSETCPSPMITVSPCLFKANMVV